MSMIQKITLPSNSENNNSTPIVNIQPISISSNEKKLNNQSTSAQTEETVLIDYSTYDNSEVQKKKKDLLD